MMFSFLAAAPLLASEVIDYSIPSSVFQPDLNRKWVVFEQPDLTLVKIEDLKTIPAKIGRISGTEVEFNDAVFQFKRKKRSLKDHSLFFNEFRTEKDGVLVLGFGADWFMKVWLDGKVLLDTLRSGNGEDEISTGNHVVRVPASKGKHLLVAEVHSGLGSYTFAAGKLPYCTIQATRFLHEVSQTDWRVIDPKRQACMDSIEEQVLHKISSTVFNAFDAIHDGYLKNYYEPFPILGIYDGALEKIADEIPQTVVPEGSVVLWHLYNMGYVIKTHRHCFGIDLHHRRAHVLAPYLDFILTTHNHSDHCNMPLFEVMRVSGKKIYSSFYPASGYMRKAGTIKIDDITITTAMTDHNTDLRDFITTYLIRIGKGKNACVIYHTGDSCNHEQLNPSEHVNIWIPHPRVGLKVVKAAEKFHPDWIFFSHHLEMGHCKPCVWRPVEYREVQNSDIPACTKLGVRSTIPLWGEKIVWTPADARK